LQWLNDNGIMAQWQQWAEEEKGRSRGGALLLKVARGGGRGRRKRRAGEGAETVSEAVGGQGGRGRGLNAVGTVAPLFGSCG
jgi:hypothetical protein